MNTQFLDELEQERQGIVPSLIISYSVFGIGLILLFIGFPTIAFSGAGLLLVGLALSITGGILLFAYANPKLKAFKKHYKDGIVYGIFRENCENVSYLPTEGFTKEMIRETGFMQLGNMYHSEDLISGKYNGVPFRRSDVLIQDHRSNGKSSYTVTYFRGRWITLNFNKTFHRDLQLVQKGFGYSKSKRSFFTKQTERRHRVEFENVQFNNLFDCYCQDDQEAFYLITPQIMEALMNYTSMSDGKVMIGFRDNIVHVAIENGKDTLEPHVMSALSYQTDVLPVKSEVNAITDFINMLHLERDAFE